MSLPNVITLAFTTGNVSAIATTAGATSVFVTNTSVFNGGLQRRVAFSAAANESGSGIAVRIVGLNQANNTITEVLALGNTTTTAVSNLDYLRVISLTPVNVTSLAATSTIGSVFAGTNGSGSSLWQIMNWHVTPTNIECAGVVAGITTAVNWGIQYTYDDPNNLPAGTTFPQPFNHPTLNNLTTSLDGSINDPVTAIRLVINSGTGSVRATIIQAGIGSP